MKRKSQAFDRGWSSWWVLGWVTQNSSLSTLNCKHNNWNQCSMRFKESNVSPKWHQRSTQVTARTNYVFLSVKRAVIFHNQKNRLVPLMYLRFSIQIHILAINSKQCFTSNMWPCKTILKFFCEMLFIFHRKACEGAEAATGEQFCSYSETANVDMPGCSHSFNP